MKLHAKRVLCFILILCFIYTGQIYASVGTADSNDSSSSIFDWKADYSHYSADYNCVTYGKGIFVAVGENGMISVSKDLKSWKETAVYCGNLSTVLFKGNVFVTADDINIYYSEDGYHWDHASTDAPIFQDEDEGISDGATDGETFVLWGNGVRLYSRDGMNWTRNPDWNNANSADAQYDPSKLTYNDIDYNIKDDGLYSLRDGKEKAEYKTLPGEKLKWMCTGNGKMVVVGTNGLIAYTDISGRSGSWIVSRGQRFKDIYSAAANNYCIIAVGKDGQILKSQDGISWQIIKTGITKSLHSIIFDGKSFIAAGDDGIIATSSDGVSWALQSSGTKMSLYSVKKLNGMYFAVGKGLTILSSKDKTNWTLVYGIEKDNCIIDEPFSGITYKDGVYYTISNNNSFVYTSKDGLNWKQTSRPDNYEYTDLIYFMGRFILVGNSMGFSSDMKAVTPIKQDFFYAVYRTEFEKISLLDGFLLTGALEGSILFSPDGTLWENTGGLSTHDCVNDFVKFKGYYYAFADNGAIVRGEKKKITPPASDITVSTFYNYPRPDLSESDYKVLENQPVFRNSTILLAIGTISNLIGCDSSYDRKIKDGQICLGKKSVKFILNSAYATVNGNRISMPQKTEVIGNSLYVPAQFTLNALGYSFSYDDSKRRIFITVDDTPKTQSLVYNPVTFKNNDGNLCFHSISYNQKIFVALANGGIICTSKDGMNWEQTSVINSSDLSQILWNGKRFIALGGTVNDATRATALIYVSEDGIQWRKVENIPDGGFICSSVIGGSGRTADEIYTGNTLKQAVAIANDGMVLTSKDGLTWVETVKAKTSNMAGLCWYKGVYYASCMGMGYVFFSNDGLKWNYYKPQMPISKIFSSDGTLWAISDKEGTIGFGLLSSKLYKSENGKDWSYINDMPNKSIEAVFYAINRYILFGYRCRSNTTKESIGFCMVSGNGDIWNYTAVPLDFENVYGVFRYGSLTLLATNKGLLTLTLK